MTEYYKQLTEWKTLRLRLYNQPDMMIILHRLLLSVSFPPMDWLPFLSGERFCPQHAYLAGLKMGGMRCFLRLRHFGFSFGLRL